jgi:hypothetical protein
MRLFDCFREPARIHVDPLFGRLECRGKGPWRGVVMFAPVSRDVTVAISTGGATPDEQERQAFLGLAEGYDAMLPAIAEELYGLYMPGKGGAPDKPPHPFAAPDMVTLTRLGGVEIQRNGGLRLFYGFIEGAGWDEATFTLRVSNWSPVGENLRD